MTTIQGDFPNAAAAERAKSALQEAGITDMRIRKWNILDDSASGAKGINIISTGSVVGGLLGGGVGLVAGAGIGAILDGDDEAEQRSPDPSGIRGAVDVLEDEPKIEAILRVSGAANVQRLLSQ